MHRYEKSQPHIIHMTDRSVLEVDVVRLEVDVAEERLEGRARRPGADEGGIEGGRDEEHGGLGVVHACLDELVVPDVHEIAGRGVPGRVEGCFGVELALPKVRHEQRENMACCGPSGRTRRVRGAERVMFTVSWYSPAPMSTVAGNPSGL